MQNSGHMLLRAGRVPIATVMRRVLTGHAVYFNRKYNRHGQLFQNRYKSILCQEDVYLKELVRYIHLNPLRAGIVKDVRALERYRWAGHSVIMGKTIEDWQDDSYVLKLFADKKSLARKRYRMFVKKGIEEGKRPDLTGGGLIRSSGGWQAIKALRKTGIRLKGDERILGDSDFVEKVLQGAKEKFERRYQLKAKGYDFNHVLSFVSEQMGITPQQVLNPNKKPESVQARSLVCYFCTRELGMTTVDIAKRLNICQSAASRSAFRGEKIAKDNNLNLF